MMSRDGKSSESHVRMCTSRRLSYAEGGEGLSSEDAYPDFDFNFQKIREYWTAKLGSFSGASRYLQVVNKRVEYWLQELGSWIDFDFAAKHLERDLGICDAESHLVWLALRRRVQLANEQRPRFASAHRPRDEEGLRVDIPLSSDGAHDRVWHEDFRKVYKIAIAQERKELKKLRETGFIPISENSSARKNGHLENVRVLDRPRLQWIWANRLLAYLLETLREQGAICDDGEMWAALDGVFRGRNGAAISRKDLALWAHQYRKNKSCGDEAGKPKKHELVDQIIEKIKGKSETTP